MAKDSGMPRKPIPETPNYIPPEKEKQFPGSGMGDQMGNFIPDAAWLNKQKYQITREQERFGLGWKPGDPEVAPPPTRAGGLNPISGEWQYPEETRERAAKGEKAAQVEVKKRPGRPRKVQPESTEE